MSLQERTKSLLRTYRTRPKKSFGQNFMIDPAFFRSMADHAALDKNDTVLDIGAGLGFLTRFVADRCRTVLAVEVDSTIASILSEQLVDLPNVKVIKGNVFKIGLPPFNKVVSIPPYSISSRLLVWLFSKKFERAVLILQKEFAERLVASPGNKDYGWLTVLAHYYVGVELLDEVPKSAFYPPPKINSVITYLKARKRSPFALKNEESFKHLLHSLFTQRNKKVRNASLHFLRSTCKLSKETAVKVADTLPFHDKRVRELKPEDFGVLANAVSD
jgi:16S rRNA (adenine1518-N6/adenine1519-N6)-dimethyltransferase